MTAWVLAALLVPPLSMLLGGMYEARRTINLSQFPPLPADGLPALSIVVAARDEAVGLRESLGSLLELDYPELEVIFVDDRSSDGTSEIADEVKNHHPQAARLTVIHNLELPQGWLGKVHALHLGVLASHHPLVLLTDGDVHFSRDALRKAATALQILGADHLAVAPRFEVAGFWESPLVAYFFVLFTSRFRPSVVHLDKNRFVGVGAFNLLTRETIERCEYLQPLRLQVVDDLHLGRMVKARGGRQFALAGQEELSVRWFRGLRGVISGLEKNAYAGMDYNFSFAIAASIFAAIPFWSLLLISTQFSLGWGAAWYLFQVILGAVAARAAGVPLWSGLAFPIASVALGYAMLRSTLLAEIRGAVIWRNTRYDLQDLRRAHHEFVARERL